jgi:ornithine lipid ester-linked acyl 2-hydroxylase
MVALIIAIFIFIVILVIWFWEARIFIFLFHKLVFPYRKGMPVNIDKKTHFPESKLLEINWKVICNELKTVMLNDRVLPKVHEVDKANFKISFDNAPAWRTVIIKAYDGWFGSNCSMFPETTKLLKKIPSVSTAMFSILEPQVKIPAHTGKLSGILRYHLALIVPATGQCYFEVNGEKYYWKEGEGILFNDTYLHSVANNSNEYRVVLFLDIKKQSSRPVQAINNFILYIVKLSPGFRSALKKGTIKVD